MFTNMSGFPGKRWHGPGSGTDLRRDVQLAGVDFATIEHAIEKRPLVRYQIEQEGEPVATERNALLDPRFDLSPGGKPEMRRRARVSVHTA